MIRRWFRRPPPPQPSDGTKAREQAERDLAAVRAETPYYQRLSRDLRTIRERNHLAEAFLSAAQGGPRD